MFKLDRMPNSLGADLYPVTAAARQVAYTFWKGDRPRNSVSLSCEMKLWRRF